ncbi:hypothetical protein [Holzapfeliella sp. JNUCC 72]
MNFKKAGASLFTTIAGVLILYLLSYLFNFHLAPTTIFGISLITFFLLLTSKSNVKATKKEPN